MRKLAAILLLCLACVTHAISYTVQVAAVSDQDAALSLVRLLLRDGYPAYFVRTTTEAGYVFRIRVGAFENRAAALVYAEEMPAVAGARPIPALAEAIPAGIMPFAPTLLLAVDLADATAEVLAWSDGVAVRVQAVEPLQQATYYPLDTADSPAFQAWNAALTADGTIVRVRNLPLWPEAAEEDSAAVRAEFASQLRALVATQLDVESAAVDDVVLESAAGVPSLVVVERIEPDAPESGEVIGLADPRAGMGRYGPTGFVAGGEAAPESPEPAVRFSADTATGSAEAERAAREPLAGEDWAAQADAGFARLDVAGLSWRAAVGSPIWAFGDLLVTRSHDRLLFYRFQMRPLDGVD